MTDLLRELIERLRADAERQDGEEESIVSTNCMRNSADALETLSEENKALTHDLTRQMTIANTECNRAEALSERIAVLETALRSIEAIGERSDAVNDMLNDALEIATASLTPDLSQ